MSKEELIQVKGGTEFSATLINAFARGINSLYNIGVALGSALRRGFRKRICH